jgi:hypothetical protein
MLTAPGLKDADGLGDLMRRYQGVNLFEDGLVGGDGSQGCCIYLPILSCPWFHGLRCGHRVLPLWHGPPLGSATVRGMGVASCQLACSGDC